MKAVVALGIVWVVSNAQAGEGYECVEAEISVEGFRTDDPALPPTATGRYRFQPEGDAPFQANDTRREHFVVQRDGCSSSVDAAYPTALQAQRDGDAFQLRDAWEPHTVKMTVACPGRPSTVVDIPNEGGSRDLRLEEKDGAQIEILNDAAMKSGVRYTLRRVSTIESLTEQLAECPATSGLLLRAAAAAADGTAPLIECDPKVSMYVPAENKILLRTAQTRCQKLSTLVQELSNATQRDEAARLDRGADAGTIPRQEFIDGYERLEFPGVLLRMEAIEQCGPEWACLSGDLTYWHKATDFQRYYEGLKRARPEHLESYGEQWDAIRRAADGRHSVAPR